MTQQLDWPRYSRLTWIVAALAAALLVLMWLMGKGPGASANCCGAGASTAAQQSDSAAAVAATTAAAAAAAAIPMPTLAHTARWEGGKLTLSGVVIDAATKKAVLDAATAQYGAGKVIDAMTVDAKAAGLINVVLSGTVADAAEKASRGAAAQAFYNASVTNTRVSVDNQLSIATAVARQASEVQCGDTIAVAATFATGSAQLSAESKKLIAAVVPCIKGPYEVGGHTDDLGAPASNIALSERRAQAVAAYLVTQGVDAARLSAKGYGPDAPIAANDSAGGRAKNRRVEFKKR